MKKLLNLFKNITIVTMLCLVLIGTTTIPSPIVFDPNAGISTCATKDPEPEPEPLDDDYYD